MHSTATSRILLVYTDKDRAASLVALLADERRELVASPSTELLPALVENVQPDLVILNPPADRREIVAVCTKLRAETDCPLLVLAAEHSEVTVAQTLAAGADEYVALPIGDRELTARVDAMLRRASTSSNGNMETDVGGIVLTASQLSVTVHGRTVFLSPIEFRVIAALAAAPGKIVTHDALMRRVWGPEYVGSRHYLHVYVRYLREKLEEDPRHPTLIVSEWGVGYRLQPPAS